MVAIICFSFLKRTIHESILIVYFVSNVFADIHVEVAIGYYLSNLNMFLVTLVFALPLFTIIQQLVVIR